jgi:hypothetical protein
MAQPVNDAAPVVGVSPYVGTWVEWAVVGGFCLVFALLALVPSYLARRHLRGVPLWALVPLCAASPPVLFFIAGYVAYNGDVNLLEWLQAAPFRAYRNFALLLASGMFAAWLVLRKRTRQIDIGVFD